MERIHKEVGFAVRFKGSKRNWSADCRRKRLPDSGGLIICITFSLSLSAFLSLSLCLCLSPPPPSLSLLLLLQIEHGGSTLCTWNGANRAKISILGPSAAPGNSSAAGSNAPPVVVNLQSTPRLCSESPVWHTKKTVPHEFRYCKQRVRFTAKTQLITTVDLHKVHPTTSLSAISQVFVIFMSVLTVRQDAATDLYYTTTES